MTSEGRIDREDRGAIALIRLDRAERRNALTLGMLVELERIADSLAADPAVRAVVLAAHGPDFSVGMDIGRMPAPDDRPPIELMRRLAGQGARTMRALKGIHQPTIAAIRGLAIGGGAALASACDFRVAAPAARLGYAEVKLGINLMWNALGPLVALVGPARAKRLVLGGEPVGAATLADWGLFDELADDPFAAALDWAGRLAALPPVGVQMAKRSIDSLAEALAAAVLHADTDQWLLSTFTPDHAAALAAFRARRES